MNAAILVLATSWLAADVIPVTYGDAAAKPVVVAPASVTPYNNTGCCDNGCDEGFMHRLKGRLGGFWHRKDCCEQSCTTTTTTTTSCCDQGHGHRFKLNLDFGGWCHKKAECCQPAPTTCNACCEQRGHFGERFRGLFRKHDSCCDSGCNNGGCANGACANGACGATGIAPAAPGATIPPPATTSPLQKMPKGDGTIPVPAPSGKEPPAEPKKTSTNGAELSISTPPAPVPTLRPTPPPPVPVPPPPAEERTPPPPF